MATTKKEEEISILQIKRGHMQVHVLGTSPLICNRLSEKAKRDLLLPPLRKSASERAATLKHDPVAEYRNSPYTLEEEPTLLAVTSSMFKGAMRTAALDLPGTTATTIGRLLYVENDYVSVYGEPKLFMAIVRNSGMNAAPDVRSRAILPQWACTLDILFAEPMIKSVSVLNLLAAAGITAGVGDWRPGKGKGAYGCFEIVKGDDPRFLRLVNGYGRDVQRAAMAKPDFYDNESRDLFEWYTEAAAARGLEPTGDEEDEEDEEVA